MKKTYSEPLVKVIDLGSQQIMDVSKPTGSESGGGTGNPTQGTGTEEVGAGSYRNNLWE